MGAMAKDERPESGPIGNQDSDRRGRTPAPADPNQINRPRKRNEVTVDEVKKRRGGR